MVGGHMSGSLSLTLIIRPAAGERACKSSSTKSCRVDRKSSYERYLVVYSAFPDTSDFRLQKGMWVWPLWEGLR